MDLKDILRTLYPKVAERTFFLIVRGTFSKIDHILSHKTALTRYKKIEIIPCICSDHLAMKLKIKNKKIWKTESTWRLKNILLKNEWINQGIKEDIFKNVSK